MTFKSIYLRFAQLKSKAKASIPVKPELPIERIIGTKRNNNFESSVTDEKYLTQEWKLC